MASDAYWENRTILDGLLDKRADISIGYDPDNGTKVLLDHKFSLGMDLSITLDVNQPPRQSPLVFEPSIAGAAAAPSGGYAYTLNSKGLQEGTNGLGLVIRVP
jgi:hypothetical protein